MEYLFKLIEKILIDKSKTIGQKSWRLLFAILILVSFDCAFNFTYDIHITNKLEKLEKVNNLKKEYKNDSLYMIQLSKLENKYRERKHYYDCASDYYFRFLNFSISLFQYDNNDIIKSQTKNDNTITNNPIRSKFWMFVSSNLILIILGFMMIITMFVTKENKKATILGVLILLVLNISLMLIFNWLSYFIPIIYGKPYINYIINFAINLLIIFGFVMLVIKNKNEVYNKTPDA
jgi:hypothetical protein